MQDHANAPRKSGLFKAIKWGLIVFAVVLVLAVVLVPVIVSSESGKNFIVSKVNQSVDGKLDIGSFSVGWFKGLHLGDLNFSDNSGEISISVKDISAKPKYGALLAGEVSVSDAVVDSPKVVINLTEDARADVKGGAVGGVSRKDTSKEKSGIDLKYLDLTIKDGDVTINHRGADSVVETVRFSNIASKVDLKPAGQESTFDVAFAVGDKGASSDVVAKGNLKTAKKGWKPKETSGDLVVKVDDLDLATLKPLFALMGQKVDVGGKLDADAEVSIVEGRVEKLSADAVLAGFKQVIEGKELVLEEPVTLKADISSDGDDVKIDKLNLKSSFCSVSGKGGMNSFDYIAEADIAKTMEVVGQFVDLGGYTFAGKATEHGTVLFDKGNVRFKGASTIDGLVVGTAGGKATPVTSAKITFDLGYDSKKNSVGIASFGIDSVQGPGKVAIFDTVIPLGEDKKDMDIRIDADLDIGKAMDYARVFDAVPEGLSVSGDLKSGVSVSKGKDGYRFLSKSTTITNLVMSGDKTTEPFKDPKVELQFDAVLDFDEKTYDFRKLKIDASQIDIEGSVKQSHSGGQTRFGGEVNASYDLAEAGKAAAEFLPKGFSIEGKRVDRVAFESTYPKGQDDKRLANMNANATLGFAKAEYMGMRFGETDVKVSVKDGIAEVAPFSTVVNEGRFNFAGLVDLQKEPMVFEMPGPMQVVEKINIDERMAAEMLRYLNPVFADQANLSGVADFHCKKLVIPLGGKADISKAQIKGTVAMSDMVMQPKGLLGQALRFAEGKKENRAELLPTEFVLMNGMLSYEDMQLNVDNHPMNFKGKILLAQKPSPLDMTVQLPYKVIFDGFKPEFETIDVGGDMTDRVPPIALEGTVENHRINMDKFAEGLLKKAADQFLKDQLKDVFKSGDGSGGEKSAEEEVVERILDIFK